MPQVTEYQIIRDTIILCLLILIINMLIGKNTGFLVSKGGLNICAIIAYAIETICSFFFAVANFFNLIKGLFLGMGHIRRVLLLISCGMFAYLAYNRFCMVSSLITDVTIIS